MRRDQLYLVDMVEAADAIEGFILNLSEELFVDNDLVRSAVLQKLIVIGEAASRLSREFRERHSEIVWSDIVAFRNIAVHAYFSIQWSVVFVTATVDVPNLKAQLKAIQSAQ